MEREIAWRAPLLRRRLTRTAYRRVTGRAEARPSRGIAAIALALAFCGAAHAQPPTERALVVGIADSPPFAIANDDGSWSGLGVELWRRIADDLDLRYEFRRTTLEELGTHLRDRKIDAAVGAMAVTPTGTALHDFTQPYLNAGLGFAQRARQEVSWAAIGRTMLDPRLLTVIGLLLLSILLVGALIAWVERRQHSTDFAGPWRDSLSTGVWWAAVTMTTVGYGDATPKTPLGRALALVWMFVGVVAVAVFTATVTSILTLSHIQSGVERPSDLQRLRLAAIEGGSGGEYLAKHQFRFRAYPDYETALQDLATDVFDVLVANRASLRYLVNASWQGQLRVSPVVLERDAYAIGLPHNSPLRVAIDEALVRIIHSDDWDSVMTRYLGHD